MALRGTYNVNICVNKTWPGNNVYVISFKMILKMDNKIYDGNFNVNNNVICYGIISDNDGDLDMIT